MRFNLSIGKEVFDENCKLDVREAYYNKATNELVVFTQLIGCAVNCAENSYKAEVIGFVIEHDNRDFHPQLKNFFVVNDEQVMAIVTRNQYKKEDCFFSKINEKNINTHHEIRTFPHIPVQTLISPLKAQPPINKISIQQSNMIKMTTGNKPLTKNINNTYSTATKIAAAGGVALLGFFAYRVFADNKDILNLADFKNLHPN